MLSRRIPVYLSVLITAFIGLAVFFWTRIKFSSNTPETDSQIVFCRENKVRMDGYKFVKPLVLSDTECEATDLLPVKNQLQAYIDSCKQSGMLTDASVYLRKLNQGEWIEIGQGIKYLPGSLMKVPELIAYIKMNEKQPGILDRKILYDQAMVSTKTTHFNSKSIELGHTYSIRELLTYMIVHSDNNATMILNRLIDLDVFKKVFTDLGLPQPDPSANDFPFTAEDYSRFMRAIYNATYLTKEGSEFCAELLSQSVFSDGLRSGVPENIPMAHKFGEAGNGGSFCFSESGIVYLGNTPYLLTIMTRSGSLTGMPSFTRELSRRTFLMMSAQ